MLQCWGEKLVGRLLASRKVQLNRLPVSMHSGAQVGRLSREIFDWKSELLRSQGCSGFVIAHCVNAYVHAGDGEVNWLVLNQVCVSIAQK